MIQDKAEQLLKKIEKLSEEIAWRLGTSTKSSDFLRAKELKKERIDVILQAFKEVAEDAIIQTQRKRSKSIAFKFFEDYWNSLNKQES